jgi:hypothetical protein
MKSRETLTAAMAPDCAMAMGVNAVVTKVTGDLMESSCHCVPYQRIAESGSIHDGAGARLLRGVRYGSCPLMTAGMRRSGTLWWRAIMASYGSRQPLLQ